MTRPKEYKTIACCDQRHDCCPGWFREHVTAPWSNAECACPCHREEAERGEHR